MPEILDETNDSNDHSLKITRREAFAEIGIILLGLRAALGCSKSEEDKKSSTPTATAEEQDIYDLLGIVKPAFQEPELMEQIESGKVVILFGADWCPPCKEVGNYLKQHEADMRKQGVNIFEFFNSKYVVNGKGGNGWSDLAKTIIAKYNLDSGLPIAIVLEKGVLVGKFEGDQIKSIPNLVSK